jgi:hypothetical protein
MPLLKPITKRGKKKLIALNFFLNQNQTQSLKKLRLIRSKDKAKTNAGRKHAFTVKLVTLVHKGHAVLGELVHGPHHLVDGLH